MLASSKRGTVQAILSATAVATAVFYLFPLHTQAGLRAAPPLLTASLSSTVATSWVLSNGVSFPTLALNTAGMSAEASERAVLEALASGIRHIDFHPGPERDGVARAIAAVFPRASVFLTTKINVPAWLATPEEAAELVTHQLDDDLAALGVDAVDMLMLRDSPKCDVMQAQWSAMEAALAAKRTRAIGVANYCEAALRCVLATAVTKPAVNYFMNHVGMGPDAGGLRHFGESRGIRTFAYGFVGEPASSQILNSPTLRAIGRAHARSVEQVALRWVLQGGRAASVRPTANFGYGCPYSNGPCKQGLKDRAAVYGWVLTRQEMRALNNMSAPAGNPTLFSAGCRK